MHKLSQKGFTRYLTMISEVPEPPGGLNTNCCVVQKESVLLPPALFMLSLLIPHLLPQSFFPISLHHVATQCCQG